MGSQRWLAVGLLSLSLAGLQGGAAAFALSAPAAADDLTSSVTQLTLAQDTQVPGKTLKSGDYTIRIVDHLSDRMIIRVEKNGKMQATFLAVPSSGLGRTGSGAIPLDKGAGAKSALRGFAFPNGTTAEFVYPKLEAVGLAKANDTKIPAIDPASQGMKGNPSLSPTDREMVTLWLLSPTTVGPDAAAGIKAERYQQQVASVTPPAGVSPASAPRRQPIATAAPAPQPVQQDPVAVAPSAPARPKTRPAMKALPHTAGTIPLVWLTGLLSLIGACLLTGRRLTAGR